MQRTKAVLHDPFPSNDLGPPIQGGRPLGFEQPKSEAASLQNSPFARRGTQRGIQGGFQGGTQGGIPGGFQGGTQGGIPGGIPGGDQSGQYNPNYGF